MISKLDGKISTMTHPELLCYWIAERELIRQRKEVQDLLPWSDDPVFQRTYFCNVRREADKVTKWIRDFYSPFVNDPSFEYNIILSRFINWPATLNYIGYRSSHDPEGLQSDILAAGDQQGKIWGGAYIITTHGIPMCKVAYLVDHVLEGVDKAYPATVEGTRKGSCAQAAHALQRVEGIGSFLSGQIVADLKNTKGHPLQSAVDWRTFVTPGPGSLKGASWFHYGEPGRVTMSNFQRHFSEIREYVNTHSPIAREICNQDLQNCLCEYDKYMRVKSGTGKSKRNYNGYR